MKKLLSLLCILNFSSALAIDSTSADLATFENKIKPILAKYCVDCHGPKKVKGKLRLDTIDPDILKGDHRDKWEDILEEFNTGEMPPEDEKQPSDSERELLSLWMDSEFQKARRLGNPNKLGDVRRLTRYELQYSLEDMFKVSAKNEVKSLPEESQSPETGLKNSSNRLMMSGPHLEAYFNVIFSVIQKVKDITDAKAYTAKLNVATYKVPVPVAKKIGKGKKGKKAKRAAPKQLVLKSDKALILKPGGSVSLKIPSIPKYLYQVSFSTQTETGGSLLVSIGYKNSPKSAKEFKNTVDTILLKRSKSIEPYSFKAYPDQLSQVLSSSIGKEYFARLTNNSKETISVVSFSIVGNITARVKGALIDKSVSKGDREKYIKGVISSFIAKAFRRAPIEREVLKYYKIFINFSKNNSGMKALLNTYEEALSSPKFFYMGVPGTANNEQTANYRLAEKLSYFLWCSIPDTALIDDAEKGRLTTPSVLQSHVKRMLKDPKSKRMVENFADQWLHTSKLFNVAVDTAYYKGFNDSIKNLMRQETIESINDVFRNNAPALNLLKADHIFVNDTLARFYKLKGVQGPEFQKVKVSPTDKRGGLLTQGTFLVGNSDGANSHAILRGVWLTEIILDDPPPAPPKTVPPFDETIPGFDKMTLNQKMFIHRNNDACRNCHNKIDPWGIPFENYDASGAWRDKVLLISSTENAKKGKAPKIEKGFIDIERKATLPSRVTIDGMKELKEYLIKNKAKDFSKGLTKKLLSFALSRDVDFYDDDLIKELNNKFISKSYSVPELIKEIVLSEQFQKGGK